MGSSGWSLTLKTIAGKPSANRGEVYEATRQFLAATWRAALPKAYAEAACEWILLGDDSLLTIGDPDEDLEDDEPATELLFLFYETVEWPGALAEHWLQLALVKARPELDETLAQLGYAIADDDPPSPDEEGRFIFVEQRIGHPDEDGVFWQLPEYDYEDYEALPPKVRELAIATRDGGPCGCPWCVKDRGAAPK